jgi:hypothetical protein
MTKHFMTSGDRTKIIEALKNNPNAAAVARQFGFGETTINRLCKQEGIGLQHLLTKAERKAVVELLKTNLNAVATAKQLGVNHKTVLAVAKKERIDIKAMRQAAKGRKTLPFTLAGSHLGELETVWQNSCKPQDYGSDYQQDRSGKLGLRSKFCFWPETEVPKCQTNV